MTDLPDLKIKTLVNFPADVIGDAGIDVNRIGGRYHLALGYGDFTPPISGVTDPVNQNVLIWNAITEEYKLASIAVLTGVSYEHLELNGTEPSITMNSFSASNWWGPWFYMYMTKGTSSSPLPVVNGDVPFGVWAGGYDGAAMSHSAGLYATVDGSVSVGNVPIGWTFKTGHLSDGGTERLRINSAGEVLINTAVNFVDARAMLSVTQNVIDWGLVLGGYGGGGFYGLVTATDGPSASAHTIVAPNSSIGSFTFAASNGIEYKRAAQIGVVIDGTPGFSSMPGMFYVGTTPTGAVLPVRRLRVNNAGHSIFTPGSATPPTLTTNGDFVLTPTSNTNMRISHRGTDGVTRVANFTML